MCTPLFLSAIPTTDHALLEGEGKLSELFYLLAKTRFFLIYYLQVAFVMISLFEIPFYKGGNLSRRFWQGKRRKKVMKYVVILSNNS